MNVFDLFATLKLDKSEYENGLNDAESKAGGFGQSVTNILGGASKAIVAGAVAGASAVGALVGESVKAYANYEQLVGGVETLFGAQGQSLAEYARSTGKSVAEVVDEYNGLQKAQSTVLENASNAYKTAGLSANEYMETVTSFASALNQSLEGNTEESAKKADLAITDMADNANKMGSSIESIQNAYQGFAKQNYTMLDNLKLGYGGTKQEMQRLLKDAEKISGQKFDLESYADVVDAIHIVQTEMGITGTTAKEAMTTISGSLGMVKGAWTNLIAGLADDEADMGKLIDNLLTSLVGEVDESGERVGGLINNVMPRVEQALEGVGTLIEEALPIVLEEIPTLIDQFIPQLIESGANMVTMIIQGLNSNMDSIMGVILQLIMMLSNTILSNLPTLVQMGANLLISLAQGIAEMLPELIPVVISVVLEIVNILTNPDTLGLLIEASIAIILALANGLIEALPQLIEAIPVIIENLLIAITENLPLIVEMGVQMIGMMVVGLVKAIPALVKAVPQIVVALVKAFVSLNESIKNIGSNIVSGILKGIKDGWNQVVSWVMDAIKSLVDAVKGALGIHSPSKVFAQIGGFMAEGLGNGWVDEIEDVKKNITNDLSFSAKPISINSSLDDAEMSGTTINQTINVNQQISTADELARAVRIESRYGLMRGVALG